MHLRDGEGHADGDNVTRDLTDDNEEWFDVQEYASAGSVDFSGATGAKALQKHGATERAMRFAATDAEWRHGCSINDEARGTV